MATEQASKRIKPNGFTPNGPLIGTHNGHFHADEALAVYLLRLLPTYNPSTLLRTRDPSLLATCHTVVDVGGEYDPRKNRYDHHQRTFDATFPSRPTKLSSAGLVYLHFGKPIIAQKSGFREDSEEVGILWNKLYAEFVEALDANDNGIGVYDPQDVKGVEKRFNDGGVSLGSLVGDLNWAFEEGEVPSTEGAQQAEDQRFLGASQLMGTIFLRKLDYYTKAWLPARTQVRETHAARFEWDDQGRIMLFQQGCPWKDHLYTIEAEDEVKEENKVLYVLYPESEKEESKWRIQAVAISKDSFESRKALPEAWRGVRDAELSAISGIDGSIFVHASGFIGGNATKEGSLSMARKAFTP
ncbi:uncharacterized protein KY384_006894 [Bacidia gigantensis]|uniref:uncharacterized protein n=1 Tax=Bacidia gigantensis TaxID=2732470 RepID=UPI001D04F36B|nr:uncharacterized protein KY384_006894 [Bacidia gigantensis]KAG8527978.1 hypothetical protein KY384_006894 [Bacidia gigantensis]